MNLEKVEIKKLPCDSEDHIYISIGNKCPTASFLKKTICKSNITTFRLYTNSP